MPCPHWGIRNFEVLLPERNEINKINVRGSVKEFLNVLKASAFFFASDIADSLRLEQANVLPYMSNLDEELTQGERHGFCILFRPRTRW